MPTSSPTDAPPTTDLLLLRSDQVSDYLRQRDGIIIPIGSTEQHGPNGLLGTDTLTAAAVAQRVAAATGVIVAPAISVGMAQHHLDFPGTISLRPTTLISVICDTVESLARNGFRRFFFLNGHGGNVPTTQAAFSEIYARASFAPLGGDDGLRCTIRNWFSTPGIVALSKELFGDAEGRHATPTEVALTWALHPSVAVEGPLDPALAPSGQYTNATHYRALFPDGRIASNPGLATGALGERILEVAVAGMVAEVEAWMASPDESKP